MRLRFRLVLGATLVSQGLWIPIPADAGEIPPARASEATRVPKASVHDPSQLQLGRIIGQVTNAGSQPLEGVTVQALQHELFSSYPILSTATDSEGRYEFTGLETSAYFVFVEDSDYLFEAWDNQHCFYLCRPSPTAPDHLVGVVSGETTAGIDFRLERPAAIRVTGVEGFRTSIEYYDPFGRRVHPQSSERFSPGTYYVRALTFGYLDEFFDQATCPLLYGEECDLSAATPVRLTEGETRELPMPPRSGSGFRGTVRDAATGEALYASLHLWNASGQPLSTSQVRYGALGDYEVSDLPPGDYYAIASVEEEDYTAVLYPDLPCGPSSPYHPESCDPQSGSRVRVTTGPPIEGIDFELSRGGSLEVAFVSATTGEEYASDIEIWDGQGQRVAIAGYADTFHAIGGLPAGPYFVATLGSHQQNQFNDGRLCNRRAAGECDPLGGVPIAIVTGETTVLHFSVAALEEVPGSLTSTGAQTIHAWDLDGNLVETVWADPAHPDFEFVDLPPGRYRFSTGFHSPHATSSIEELYDDIPCLGGPGVGCSLDDGTVVTVPLSGSPESIDFDLDPGGTISGTTTAKSTQEPEDWVTVDIVDSTGQVVRQTHAKEDGQYLASGLTPGVYRVVAVPSNPVFLSQVYGLGSCGDCDPLEGDPVAVGGTGAPIGIDFELDARPSFCDEAGRACLLGNRFLIEGSMRDFSDPPHRFFIHPMTFSGGRAESDQAAFFESFSEGNFELGVKMVNGCVLPDEDPLRSYWVFIGGLTNAHSEVEIVDTVSGQTLTWVNPRGEFPRTYANTTAFPCVDGNPTCARSDGVACLLDGRFQVSGSMEDFETPPDSFPAHVMNFAAEKAVTEQAAFFETFSPGNFELGVKMVDACDLPPGNPLRGYWTFYGGLTNAETELSVTQLSSGTVDRFTIGAGETPTSVGRIHAFDCE